MDTDINRVKAIQAEAKQLEAYLSALTPDDWERPSRCDQWQLSDVVAHLISLLTAKVLERDL